MFNVFHLAEALGKTMTEISDMTMSEYRYWQAYFKVKRRLQK